MEIPMASVNMTIDELDLSVRSFNCLKRAGIDTVCDLFTRLDEGLHTIMSVRNMGKKSLEEVLRKAKKYGYPAEIAVERYIANLRQDPEVRADSIQPWEWMRDSLRQIEPEVQLKPVEHVGMPLDSLKDIRTFYLGRLKRYGIVTAEEVINLCPTEDDIPLPDHGKWHLLRILDQNGYRLRDCSKEQWPDIEDYILFKRATHFTIDALGLPEGIEEQLKMAGVTVEKIIYEDWTFLQNYLANYEIAAVLYAMDCHDFRIKEASRNAYPEIVDFINQHIIIPTADLEFSPRIKNSLQQHSIETLTQLQTFTRQQLIESKVVGLHAMKELVRVMMDNHVHLKGDKFYNCTQCGTQFVAPEEPGDKHYCEDCSARIKRCKRMKDYVVTIDGPDYGSYTNGTKGFTIFATVHNTTKKLIEVKLRDFRIFCDNRQWAANSYLNGYNFETEHILPESSQTAAKIWSGSPWWDKKLVDGNYVSFNITIKDKTYFYKFVMKYGKFEIYDYHTY